MAYYKLVSDGVVLDAICDETAQWVVENLNNYSTYIGERERAKGVLSSDGSRVYHIAGMEKFHDFDYISVTMEEIGEGEHRAILEDIEAGKTVMVEDPSVENGETGNESEPVTLLRKLEKQVKALLEEPVVEVDNSIAGRKSAKVAELSAACNAVIVGGIDIELGDGEKHHFSLTVEDQINIASLQVLSGSGQPVPYHADGEECRFFDAEEFNALITAATQWKLYHESYFNSMKAYVMALEDVAEINTIAYGDPIPEEYQSTVLKALLMQG